MSAWEEDHFIVMSPAEREDSEKLEFIEKLKVGVPRIHAAFEVGWSTKKLAKFMRDREFVAMVADAEDYDIGTIEKTLGDKAKGGNMEAIKMVLTNRAPHRWSERKEINVTANGQVLVAHIDATRDAIRSLLEDPNTRQAAVKSLSPGGVLDVVEAEVIDDDDEIFEGLD